MMTERGPYDDIIDRIRHEKRVEQLLLQSNLNARTNTLVKLTAQKNEEYLRKELQENEMLMKTLAKAQAEIAAAAIEEWKKQQIQKAKNNPGTIINSGLGGKKTGGS
jgi:4-alpha-glucanotransferase